MKPNKIRKVSVDIVYPVEYIKPCEKDILEITLCQTNRKVYISEILESLGLPIIHLAGTKEIYYKKGDVIKLDLYYIVNFSEVKLVFYDCCTEILKEGDYI